MSPLIVFAVVAFATVASCQESSLSALNEDLQLLKDTLDDTLGLEEEKEAIIGQDSPKHPVYCANLNHPDCKAVHKCVPNQHAAGKPISQADCDKCKAFPGGTCGTINGDGEGGGPANSKCYTYCDPVGAAHGCEVKQGTSGKPKGPFDKHRVPMSGDDDGMTHCFPKKDASGIIVDAQPSLTCGGGECHPGGDDALTGEDEVKKTPLANVKVGRVNMEQCSAGWDFGWCTGCVCAHCRTPQTHIEACKDFDPKETCSPLKKFASKTGRGGTWCQCCVHMHSMCKNGKYYQNEEYSAKYYRDLVSQFDKILHAGSSTDWSQTHGLCKNSTSKTRDGWKDGLLKFGKKPPTQPQAAAMAEQYCVGVPPASARISAYKSQAKALATDQDYTRCIPDGYDEKGNKKEKCV